MACDNTYVDTASYILYECEDSAGSRPHHLGKHFMETSDYDKIPLCEILYFIRGMVLLAKWERWRMHNRSKNGHGERVALHTHHTYIHTHTEAA
jgi:hypothetical protein